MNGDSDRARQTKANENQCRRLQDGPGFGNFEDVMHRKMSKAVDNACCSIRAVPPHVRQELIPVAKKVFWWGKPEEWLDDAVRFTAQVMTFGDWNDVRITLKLLGDALFRQVLSNPPPGVFDIKSWTFWHLHYQLEVPPLPTRKL